MNARVFGCSAGDVRVLLAIVALGIGGEPNARADWRALHFPPSGSGAGSAGIPYREPFIQESISAFGYELRMLSPDWRDPSAPPLRFPVRGPLLGQPLPPVPEGKASEAAARLQPFVAEPFFAPLSLLLADGPVSPKRSEMLEQYRTLKAQVVERLCAELDAVEGAGPGERSARLAAFAQNQAPEVAAVEAKAEAIRQELFRTRWLESGADWEDARESQQARRAPKAPEEEQLEWLQLAAAFGPELSHEQRGLLQEASMEIVDRVHGASDASLLYFSPSNSRIRLPDNLPEAVVRRVASYRELKGSLMEGLRIAVFSQRRSGERERTAAFGTLRVAQADGIAKLEQLAEEIRAELASSPSPIAPPAVSIPVGLAPQIADYLGAKVEAQRAFVVKLAEVRTALPKAQAEVVSADRGYRIEVDLKGASTGKGEAVLASLPAFHEEQARRYTELLTKRKALMQALKAATGRPLQGSTRSVDDLLQEFAAAQAWQENWNKYRDYRRAVLEPGLSAGQRRLLFSTAVEKLVGPYYR